MIFVHLVILFGAIILGARLGSIGIGMAGGLGVILLGLTGITVSQTDIPFDVVGIIMTVIAAIAAMQRAGGLDYLVHIAERFLRRNPSQITYWAPVVTWLLTFTAGTGHTAFSTLPVIVEVAKEGKVRPSRPLSMAVISSQMAIVASPISAAVVFMAGLLEPMGVSYLQLLGVMIPATFLTIFPTAWIASRMGKELEEDPVVQQRISAGLVAKPKSQSEWEIPAGAKASVGIFLGAIALVIAYATAISQQISLIENPSIPRNEAIMGIMLAAAAIIVLVTKIPAAEILETQVFRSGMSAAVCVLGVAWLGTTFIKFYIEEIQELSGDLLRAHPWMLAVVLFFAACLLYSQASTAKALMPAAAAIGVAPISLVAAFPAVSALFVLPTYPTLLAAVEMDDTGSTRIGKFVFNHPFLLPGTACILISIIFAYGIGAVIL